MVRPVEREFNENKPILEESINQELIILHYYIKDYMHANNGKPYKVTIADPIISSVKSARKNKNIN